MTTAINTFDSHIQNFLEAADLIDHYCISFAGHTHHTRTAGIGLGVYAFNFIFARVFSQCDPLASSYNFECVVEYQGREYPCMAIVGVDGSIEIMSEEKFNLTYY